ncbi:hypothetical protein PCANB_000070 [Pneumocystis canis]|nr:hypothetical protein PCANB_000070 [Pneumocystis canis]
MTQESQELSNSNQKISLVLWWKHFKQKQGWKKIVTEKKKGVFGVPLQISLRYANVAISFIDNNGNSIIYGYIPIVVAKCGAFLKENGKNVKGIFRLNGSAKRCKELQTIFDSQPKYGRNLKWDNFTVHDAASILRRYLNYLPEPIIPHKFYDAFRKPLRKDFYNKEKVISIYKRLIASLPLINQQLLLYILDLLAVFASKSDENLMTVSNLSSIFQPGILSHPEHDMSPKDYFLSQNVVIFLINHQDHFLKNTIEKDSDILTLSTYSGKYDSSETVSIIDSIKFTPIKKLNVLKKTSYTSLKFQNSFKNKHSNNTLPNKTLNREIDPCIVQNSVSFKKSNISRNPSRLSLWKLSTEDDKMFYNKVKKKNSFSTLETSMGNSYIYSAPKISRNTKSIIYGFPLSLMNVARLSRRFQKKSIDKIVPTNFSSSSLKTTETYSNTSLRPDAYQSFSSQSTHSAHFSRVNSTPSSITSEDRLSRDHFLSKKWAELLQDNFGERLRNPHYAKKYSYILKRKTLKNKTIGQFDIPINNIEFEKGYDICPFISNCYNAKNKYSTSNYRCFDYSSENITDIFRICNTIAVFLKINNNISDSEPIKSTNNGEKSHNSSVEDNGIFKGLYSILKTYCWTSKHNELNFLEDMLYKFKSHLDKCSTKHESLHSSEYLKINQDKKNEIFKFLFPSSPIINSLLATFYISGPPNFILFLIPYNINTFFLNVLVAFAVGGLLGDVFLHLLPQIFLNKETHDDLNIILFDEQRNTILVFLIFFGFISFVLMDKTMRLFSKHSHNHDNFHDKKNEKATAVSTSISLKPDYSNNIKKRIITNENKNIKVDSSKSVSPSKMSFFGYLNLIADFSHNFTDGLALFTSFHISYVTGATTTMAVFFHEIPHEIGDFAILLQSGFTKYQALGCQFITSIGAFLGTFVGILIHQFSESTFTQKTYLFNTSISMDDLILSFITGTFLYVGTVGIIPQLLMVEHKNHKIRKMLVELVAAFLGFGSMIITP